MAVSQAAAEPAGPERLTYKNPYSALPNWLYPTWVVVALSAFVVYATWVVLFEHTGRWGPYLSPFFSPEVNVVIGGFAIPGAIWVAWAPLSFRFTCYYYRKAYFRSFFWHPRSCAVPEHSGQTTKYKGETGLFQINNFHRFAFYVTALQVVILWYDAIVAFSNHGAFHFGLGTAILLVNVVALSGYTFGCHAFRNLSGGSKDCFSCHKARYQLWKGVTVLNIRHDRWAWVSMFTVWGADLYIRLLAHGVIPTAGWV